MDDSHLFRFCLCLIPFCLRCFLRWLQTLSTECVKECLIVWCIKRILLRWYANRTANTEQRREKEKWTSWVSVVSSELGSRRLEELSGGNGKQMVNVEYSMDGKQVNKHRRSSWKSIRAVDGMTLPRVSLLSSSRSSRRLENREDLLSTFFVFLKSLAFLFLLDVNGRRCTRHI